MSIPQTSLAVPDVDGKPPLVIDMTRVMRAEVRHHEVATVTPYKAGELMMTFNRAWMDMAEAVTKVRAQRDIAKRRANKRRASIMLNQVPEKLAPLRKSIGGAAKELADAIVETDEEYQKAQEVVDQLDAMYEFLKEKKMFFAMAFSTVKSIFKDKAYDHSAVPLNGSVEEAAEPGQVVDEDGYITTTTTTPSIPTPEPAPTPTRARFGKARL